MSIPRSRCPVLHAVVVPASRPDAPLGHVGRSRFVLTALLLAGVVCSPSARPQEQRDGDLATGSREPGVRWEPHVGETLDGRTLEGRLGRITVPENRSSGSGREIEIAFVHYATRHPDPGPPIFFLVGGPGPSGIEWCAEAALDDRLRLLDHADVIGIDQRGTGFSGPGFDDGPRFEYELPLDRAITREDVIEAWQGAMARSYEHWTEAGVDLSAYNTMESADDVDAVRAALGYDAIVPVGTSYGSHLGLAYLRRHSEHAARALLMKVEGPDATWKLPSSTQRHLERLSEMVAADPGIGADLPDLVGTVRSILARLEQEPVQVTSSRGGETYTVVIGPYDVQTVVATALGHASNLAGLPSALALMEQGEYEHVLGFALRNRYGDVGTPMAIMMDCSSGATPGRTARIESERLDPENLLADAIAAPFYPETGAACGNPDLGDDFRAPFRCDVPVLFVSGDLDARTPPENVDAILDGFEHGAHLLVRNTGHDARELESAEYRQLVEAFLRGETVESTTITLPPLLFRPLGRPGR